MTETERTDNAELIKEATALGLSGFHRYSVEGLEAAVEEGREQSETKNDAPEPKRMPPPKMDVAGVGKDMRTKLISELEAKYPGEKFLFVSASMTSNQMAEKGVARTEYRLGNDVVVRTDKKSYEDRINAFNASDRKLMDAIDDEGLQVKSLSSAPKKGNP